MDKLALSSYAICCTLRTGSNLLCDLLAQRGFGSPTEWFQTERYQNKHSGYLWPSLPPIDALYNEFSLQSTSGWRGVKWTIGQFEAFREAVQRSSSRTQSEWLPNLRWIRLRRLDTVGQAVSLYIAKHSGVWVAGDRGNSAEELVYSFTRICRLYCELLAEEAIWDGVFAELGEQESLCVWFEELISHPEEVAARVGRFLSSGEGSGGLSVYRMGEIRSASLRRSQSGEFVERFRRDLLGGAHRELDSLLPRLREMLSVDPAGYGRSLKPLLMGLRGKGFSLRKLVPSTGRIVGGSVVSGEHFLEDEAVKLDVGDMLAFNIEAARIRIDFLAHPWSGVAVIELDGVKIAELDLYSMTESVRPLQFQVSKASVELVIRATGERQSLSEGGEVWVQRVLCLNFDRF